MTLVPGHMTSVPGHMTLVPGHKTSVPGHMTLVPGHMALVPGHMTSVPGHMTLVPRHMVSRKANRKQKTFAATDLGHSVLPTSAVTKNSTLLVYMHRAKWPPPHTLFGNYMHQ